MGLEALFKGLTGELKTRAINGLFLDEQYRVFDNVIIPTRRGSTQIDHIIVSEYGVFVVETKDKTGWIFGDSRQSEWTQSIYGKKYRFQNPLRQNYGHVEALVEFLGIQHAQIHSVVVFWGDCEFRTPMPENVTRGGIFGGEFKRYIESKTALLLFPEDVARICSALARVKERAGVLDGWRHTQEVKKRYNSTTTCPKCGADLIERESHQGGFFLGCSNYPRCRYTKDL